MRTNSRTLWSHLGGEAAWGEESGAGMLQGRLRPEQVLGGMFGTGGGFGTSSGGFYVIGRKGRRRPAVGLSLWGNLWLDWGKQVGMGADRIRKL